MKFKNIGMMAQSALFFSITISNAVLAASTPATEPARTSDEVASIQTFDGESLSGKWMVPHAPKAVVLILQGSGNVGSDGDVSSPLLGAGFQGGSAKLSDQIAVKLASAGVASLRYAKRGFDDPKQLVNQTFPFLVRDAKSALAAARIRFPDLKQGIVGFSEGALVASIVASEVQVDALFLLGLPTLSIDAMLSYQFVDWPVELVRRNLDVNHDGNLSLSELAGDKKIPLLGAGFSPGVAMDFDFDHDGKVSISNELIPSYQGLHSAILGLVQTPQFSGWYQSLKQLAPFSEYAQKIRVPVFLYQAIDDAQIRWSDVVADQRYFSGKTALRLFSNLGHCFAPMDGTYGEVKTSGPFSNDFLSALAADVTAN